MPEEETVSYSGSESYRYVDPLIQGSRRVWIISPYIGKHYGEMLRNFRSDRDVRIITMNVKENAEGVLALSKRNPRRSHSLFGVSLIMVLLVVLSYIYGLGLYVLAFTILFVIFIYQAIKAEAAKPAGRVKLMEGKLIHEKVYIGDGVAVVGSANLTYSGMHKNIEHIEVIKEGDRIAELEKHFRQLWNGPAKA